MRNYLIKFYFALNDKKHLSPSKVKEDLINYLKSNATHKPIEEVDIGAIFNHGGNGMFIGLMKPGDNVVYYQEQTGKNDSDVYVFNINSGDELFAIRFRFFSFTKEVDGKEVTNEYITVCVIANMERGVKPKLLIKLLEFVGCDLDKDKAVINEYAITSGLTEYPLMYNDMYTSKVRSNLTINSPNIRISLDDVFKYNHTGDYYRYCDQNPDCRKDGLVDFLAINPNPYSSVHYNPFHDRRPFCTLNDDYIYHLERFCTNVGRYIKTFPQMILDDIETICTEIKNTAGARANLEYINDFHSITGKLDLKRIYGAENNTQSRFDEVLRYMEGLPSGCVDSINSLVNEINSRYPCVKKYIEENYADYKDRKFKNFEISDIISVVYTELLSTPYRFKGEKEAYIVYYVDEGNGGEKSIKALDVVDGVEQEYTIIEHFKHKGLGGSVLVPCRKPNIIAPIKSNFIILNKEAFKEYERLNSSEESAFIDLIEVAVIGLKIRENEETANALDYGVNAGSHLLNRRPMFTANAEVLRCHFSKEFDAYCEKHKTNKVKGWVEKAYLNDAMNKANHLPLPLF